MDIYKFLGKEFKCEYCGKRHKIDIKFIEKGNIKNLPELISSVYGKGKKILVLCDDITYDVAGKQIEKVIKKGNVVKQLVLKKMKKSNSKRRISFSNRRTHKNK